MCCIAWILPACSETSSACAPAFSTAAPGSVSPASSTPSVARKATRFPCNCPPVDVIDSSPSQVLPSDRDLPALRALRARQPDGQQAVVHGRVDLVGVDLA